VKIAGRRSGELLARKQFFSSQNRDGLPGVQRRGPVKDAARPRLSKILDREHRWKTPSLKGAGEVEKKSEKEKRLRLRTPREEGRNLTWLAASGWMAGS